MIEFEISALAAGGDGIGRHPDDGKIIFVPGALPGDHVRAELTPAGKTGWRTRHMERVSDGPERGAPDCAHRPACGGCDWHELAASAQARWKQQILKDALSRIGGFSSELTQRCEVLAPAKPPVGRFRVRLAVEKRQMAYHRAGSHDLVVIDRCAALAPELDRVLQRVQQMLRTMAPGLTGISAGLSAARDRVALRLHYDGGEVTAGGVHNACKLLHDVEGVEGVWCEFKGKTIRVGDPWLSGLIATGARGGSYGVRAGNFFQADPGINQAMVAAVVDAAGALRGKRLVDLHGGAGNFGLALAARGADVTIAEVDPLALEDLARNAKRFRGRGKVYVAEMPAAQALSRQARRGEVAVAIFDAPRGGDREGAEAVAKHRPTRVIAFGCDPATFARDLKIMGLGEGYSLARLGLWDAFPGTHHLEAFAVLDRVKGAQR
jgi:23S rRNA (uracil1939-C5)-methyltransferase